MRQKGGPLNMLTGQETYLKRLIGSELVDISLARRKEIEESSNEIKALTGHIGNLEDRT